jgi:Mce-associated membrane protein
VTPVTTQKRTIRGLAILVLVAAVALAWLARDAGVGASTDITSAEDDAATVASTGVKETALEVASDAATRAYSYSWKTLADDRAEAVAVMTNAMQRRYDRTMAGVGTSSRRDHAAVSAEVVDTALVTATSSYARVLLFVNQRTTGDTLDKPTLDLDRVLVTLVRTRDGWRLDELDAL